MPALYGEQWKSGVEGYDRTDGGFRFVDLRLTVELGPAWMKLSHLFHHVFRDLSFFFELGEDSVEFVVDGHGRVLLQLSVAARGFNVVLDFVDVLLVAEYNDGIPFVGRKIAKILFLLLKRFQGSPLSVSEVVWRGIFTRVVVGEDGSCLVGGRGFHAGRKLGCDVLDERSEDGSRVVGRSGNELQAKV